MEALNLEITKSILIVSHKLVSKLQFRIKKYKKCLKVEQI